MMKKMLFSALVMTLPAFALANGLPGAIHCRDKASFDAQEDKYPGYLVMVGLPEDVWDQTFQTGSVTLKGATLAWMEYKKKGDHPMFYGPLAMQGQISLGTAKNELDFGQVKVFLEDWGHVPAAHQDTFRKASVKFGNGPAIALTCRNS
jgi:hypothetical protein